MGKWSTLTNIFQMCWNHQLDIGGFGTNCLCFFVYVLFTPRIRPIAWSWHTIMDTRHEMSALGRLKYQRSEKLKDSGKVNKSSLFLLPKRIYTLRIYCNDIYLMHSPKDFHTIFGGTELKRLSMRFRWSQHLQTGHWSYRVRYFCATRRAVWIGCSGVFFFRDVSMRLKHGTDLKLCNDVWFDLLRNFQKKCSAF